MKKPCEHCPFRSDIRPFLHPARVIDICNADYFPCHKTVDYSDDDGEGVVTEKSKICAGFESINGMRPKIKNVYKTPEQMMLAYSSEWCK